jgi:NADH-quinone oxidoreductase subunit F
MERVLARVEHGRASEQDLTTLLDVADNIEGNTICALGDAAAWPVQSYLRHFRPEFVEHVASGRCPVLAHA